MRYLTVVKSIITKGVTVYMYTDILQYVKINFVLRYDFSKTSILEKNQNF
jgi:hypothetical protein